MKIEIKEINLEEDKCVMHFINDADPANVDIKVLTRTADEAKQIIENNINSLNTKKAEVISIIDTQLSQISEELKKFSA